MNDDHFPWSPISAYDLHTTYTSTNTASITTASATTTSSSTATAIVNNKSNNNNIIKYTQNLYEQKNVLEALPLFPTSLFFPNPVDLQVWRIHPTWNIDTCLTYTTYTATTANIRYNLTWSMCIDHRRDRGSTLLYDASQLFSIYIQPHNIHEFNIQTNKYTQTTLITNNNSIKNITRIMIYNYLNNNGILCLTVLPKKDKVLVYIYTVVYL